MFFVNYTESLAQVFRDSLAFGWARKGIGWLATKWLLVHPLHLAQDLAFIHGQHGGIFPHLLEHSTTLKLIAGLLEVVPVVAFLAKLFLEVSQGEAVGLHHTAIRNLLTTEEVGDH